MKKTGGCLIGACIIIILAGGFARADESVTLTTYYPAPFGVYRTIRLAPQSSGPGCDGAKEGTLYYSSVTHQLHICTQESGVYLWKKVVLS